MLQLTNISKTYGRTIALQSIDLSIPTSQTTILLGQSGCGKSTLLRIINGLVEPDSGGSVLFEGARIEPKQIMDIRHRMGYVIQEGGLFPHLTAYENTVLMARYLDWPQDRMEERVTELARLTRLPIELLHRFPTQLSGGQRQRVSLMRALMLDPDVLLLDEPLGALDPVIRAELQTDLKNIFKALGKTVVIVTHDIGEAGFLGDIIVLLRDGKIVQKGHFSEFIHAPADPFVTQFINAQRNFLDILNEKETGGEK
uniref:Osmoprotectant transport system ATP-binding protein n=1 Tax=Candidatus Kentrum sp. MB TaxID=2138164 RepID=A0A451BDX8_9GAMM|nr:MAG: osmoprotectant transport system ATP-binding protein [Candidatus Kentron sp. MB]VFK34384.1 MAG: osmoprotectant transport system ATP-binding protein [Candidatus Kentron sp. MB]VFK76489.1 MAG: osmoprotectant transport system ATP-binding protein [Candidatus Kentron sp. MB]